MVTIPGSNVAVPGRALVSRPTQHPNAWSAHPITLELYRPFEAVRVHRRSMSVIGDWFAIGDVAMDYLSYKSVHALPKGFRFTGLFVLHPGTVLNVGRCSPLFGQPGGGYQAEFLDGRFPQVRVHRTDPRNVVGSR